MRSSADSQDQPIIVEELKQKPRNMQIAFGISLLCLTLVQSCAAPAEITPSVLPDTSKVANTSQTNAPPAKIEATQAPEPKGATDIGPETSKPSFFDQNSDEESDLYIIRKGDKLEVKMFDEPDLTATQVVDGSGRLNLELIGRIKVAELSVKQTQALIEQRYEADYLINPRATVTVTEKAQRRFVILGQVRSPGFYEVPRSLKLNVFQAIALAGGYTRIAGKVTIKRTTTEGEEIERFRIRTLRRKPKNEIPLVAEDDTIIVGESLF